MKQTARGHRSNFYPENGNYGAPGGRTGEGQKQGLLSEPGWPETVGRGLHQGQCAAQASGIPLLCLQKAASTFSQEIKLWAKQACGGEGQGPDVDMRSQGPSRSPRGKRQQDGGRGSPGGVGGADPGKTGMSPVLVRLHLGSGAGLTLSPPQPALEHLAILFSCLMMAGEAGSNHPC